MILWLPRWFRQDGRLTQEQVAEHIANLALGGLVRRQPASVARRLRARLASAKLTRLTPDVFSVRT